MRFFTWIAILSVLPQPQSPPTSLAFNGLPPIAALAVSPQGGLFASVPVQGGLIIQIFASRTWNVLYRTGGRPVGLAFEETGDLLVADSALGSIVRVTPWGQASVASNRCGGAAIVTPESVAIAEDGTVYFTDSGTSRVCRIGKQADAAVVTAEVKSPVALAVSRRELFVADHSGKIWRVSLDGKQRREFATLKRGRPAAMALDEKGNLYAALRGEGAAIALSPEGGTLDTYPIPRPESGQLAFGGADLRTLFVGASSDGTVFKLRPPNRAQRQVWEPDSALSISNPPDGAILNRHDGQATEAGLRITVDGASRRGGSVRVNGTIASVLNGKFAAQVTLTGLENKIEVEDSGGQTESATVYWDRDSFPRYRFSTDDNIRCFEDIARNADKYKSIFENPYMAMWRDLHRKYGTKVHHNIYYRGEGFDLSQMPDKFRSEWQQNSDWMRLSFHALANDPDRPYVHASVEQILRDYRMVVREIERFAGKEVLHPITTVHWGETTLAAARALRREGIRTLVGYFETRGDLPSVGYYLTAPHLRYMLGRDYWKDTREDIAFVRHDIVINTVPLAEIDRYLDRVTADPHQAEVMELMIHEQYFYPDYRAYEPDYRQRVERAIEWVTKRGYKPVFYEDGFLGVSRDRYAITKPSVR